MIWEDTLQQKIFRVGIWGNKEQIDPYCVFFVLYLEDQGVKTLASCEGHPKGFYIFFEAPIENIRKVFELFQGTGIVIEYQGAWDSKDRWRMSFFLEEEIKTEVQKREALRKAAEMLSIRGSNEQT